MMRARSSLVVAVAAFTLAFAPGVARAAPDEAEQLFDRGHALMEKNSTLNEACEVLQHSYALAERGDTLLNLAECHRRQGKTASAWSEFDHAIRVGMKVKFLEAVAVATKLRDDLALRLSRVRVEVPPAVAALDGLTLQLNGKPWPKAAWNKAEIHDPGPLGDRRDREGLPALLRAPRSRRRQGREGDRDRARARAEARRRAAARRRRLSQGAGLAVDRRRRRRRALGRRGRVRDRLTLRRQRHRRALRRRGALRGCPRSYDLLSDRARETRGFDLFVGLGAAGVAAMGVGLGFGLALRRGSNGERTGLVLAPTSAKLEQTF